MLLHIVDWIKVHPDAAMNARTRSGAISSFSFVGTQMFLLGPLIHGGTVCIAPEEARKDLGSLYRFLRDAGITHIFLPSSLAAILAEDYDISGISTNSNGLLAKEREIILKELFPQRIIEDYKRLTPVDDELLDQSLLLTQTVSARRLVKGFSNLILRFTRKK
jgi:non-ribosomal peptide synthetase component F